jgi:hypothetical protein
VSGWAKVASAPNETVATMMEGLLRETGIPVLVQRASGFDVPEFLAAGPRQLMVPETELEEARRILEDTTGLGSWGT